MKMFEVSSTEFVDFFFWVGGGGGYKSKNVDKGETRDACGEVV
jgi:hypothetical protein